jgi:hypothetical protein
VIAKLGHDDKRQDDDSARAFLLREGVLIAAVPLFGYAIAFSYDAVRAAQFGVPYSMISIGITDVLRTLAATFIFPGILACALFAALRLVSPKVLNGYLFGVVVFLLFASVVMLQAMRATGLTWLIVMSAAIGFLALGFSLDVFWGQRKVSGFRKKVEASQVAASKTQSDAANYIVQRLGPRNFGVVLTGVMLILLAALAGGGSADHQRVFLARPGTNQILVATYSDKYVFESVRHDRLTGKLFVESITDGKVLALVPRRVGPFKTTVVNPPQS